VVHVVAQVGYPVVVPPTPALKDVALHTRGYRSWHYMGGGGGYRVYLVVPQFWEMKALISNMPA
jgi:hypothetical protein